MEVKLTVSTPEGHCLAQVGMSIAFMTARNSNYYQLACRKSSKGSSQRWRPNLVHGPVAGTGNEGPFAKPP